MTKQYEPDRIVWEGIAKGNIGYNYYLRNDPDTALLWLIPAINSITRGNDYAFVSHRAIDVANIYLKKNNSECAKKYIDIALDYHNKTRITQKDSQLYDILTRYYTFIGEKNVAAEYLDSLIVAQKKENEDFSGLVLRRVEQQLRTTDQKMHEQALNMEQHRSQMYFHAILFISGTLIIIFTLLILVLFFYRRKRNAYRELVLRGQTWAGIDILQENQMKGTEKIDSKSGETDKAEEYIILETSILPEESDKIIMEEVDKIITEKKLYKHLDLTLDILAREVGFNRYYISIALNRCVGKNFNTYINEYRIKEAIRLVSDPLFKDKTIESIAFESGFNDRKNFHRVFKKMTGLSPGNFRKNQNT